MTLDSIVGNYQNRIEAFAAREARFDHRVVVWGIVVRLCNAGIAGCLLLAWLGDAAQSWLAGALLLLVVSVAASFIRERQVVERDRNRALRRVNQQAIARIERSWDDLPLVDVALAEDEAMLADDLDLFGRGSLFHLICTANTTVGIATLRDWLLRPAAPEEIKQRQRAVAELAPQLDLRQNINSRSRLLVDDQWGIEDVVEWAGGPTWLSRHSWLKWTMRVVAATVTALPVLVLLQVVPPTAGMLIFVAAVAMNIAFTILFAGKAHEVFRIVCPGRDGRGVPRSDKLFALLTALHGESQQVGDIKRTAHEASGHLRRLKHVMQLASLSRNPWTAIFVYLPLQFLVGWDFHVFLLLERWQRQCGPAMRGWFEAFGRYEALESLALLAHDNPTWVFPEVDESAAQLDAMDLAHPLLRESIRIGNDVRLGPAGKLMLITGSNMSGKSTLIRAIGTNVVLAQAGSAVCATRLTMPPLVVATSIHIADSLKAGVSFFMAEVQRLKRIVDLSKQFVDGSKATLLVLLDEVFQGTNTAERRLATCRVLGHLIQRRVIGAVTTHDLELIDDLNIKESFQLVHFRESLHDLSEEPRMSFDYKMRPGIAPSTNALKLLDMVGLEPC